MNIELKSNKGRPKKDTYQCKKCQGTFITSQTRINHERSCKTQQGQNNLNTSYSVAPQQMNTLLNDENLHLVQLNHDRDLGFNHSDIDGEEAYNNIKNKIVPYLKATARVQGDLPTISSQSQKKTDVSSKGNIIEAQKKLFISSLDWTTANVDVLQSRFAQLPLHIDQRYAICFLISIAELPLNAIQYQHELFIMAFSKVINVLEFRTIPEQLLQVFTPFMNQFKVQEYHRLEDLKPLFKLATYLKSDLHWLVEVEEPQFVVVDDTNIELYSNYLEVVELFMSYRQLYSWEYIALMRSQLNFAGKYRINVIKVFLDILAHKNTSFTTLVLANAFDRYINNLKAGSLEQIQDNASTLLQQLQLPIDVLLSYLEIAVALKGTTAIIEYHNKKSVFRTYDQLLAFIAVEEKDNVQKKLDVIEMNKQKVAEEEAKKFVAEQEQLELEELEGQKRKEAEEKQIKEESIKQERIAVYHQLCTLNVVAPDDQAFLVFIEKITSIAVQLPKSLIKEVPTPIIPRAEQLAVMFLLLTSQYQRTIIQLVTNFGKSMMFGLLAQYINQTYNRKVVVVVPNETLAAFQQKKYCPIASKVGDNLYTATVDIHYCTYDQFQSGSIPANTLLLIDEVDSLFFDKKKIEIIKDISRSPLILLNKYKVIGMTATFRGDQGKAKMLAFLHDSIALKIAGTEPERDVSKLEVFGRCKDLADVEARTIWLALEKQKESPVIIILPIIADCERLAPQFSDCFVFGSGSVVDQLGAMEFIQMQQQPMVLTTAEASLGQDLTSTAYVIQTLIPDSWSIFVQNAGRSNRIDPTAPLIGALICTNPVLTMDSVKSGCEHLQSQAKLFAPDYLKRLEILETCAKADATLSTFTSAFKKFKQGVSAAELYKLLSKVTKFKVALEVSGLTIYPTSTSSNEFKAPVPKQLLGKRKEPESPVKEQDVSAKKPCQWQQMVPKRGGCLYEHELVGPMRAPFAAVACQQCSQKTKEQLYHCSGCKKYYCYLCHETAAQEKLAGALKDLWDDGGIYGDQVSGNAELMADVHENAELRADILQEHNVQQAKLVLEAAVQKQASSSSSNDEDSNDNEHEHQEREQKQQAKEDKLETQSMVSADSKISRSTIGRFEAKYKVGDKTSKGSIIYSVAEENWKLINKKDERGNSYYQCLKCESKPMRKDNRRFHPCQ